MSAHVCWTVYWGRGLEETQKGSDHKNNIKLATRTCVGYKGTISGLASRAGCCCTLSLRVRAPVHTARRHFTFFSFAVCARNKAAPVCAAFRKNARTFFYLFVLGRKIPRSGGAAKQSQVLVSPCVRQSQPLRSEGERKEERERSSVPPSFRCTHHTPATFTRGTRASTRGTRPWRRR